MSPETLQDLFVEQLKDVYSAENQLVEALPLMANAASSEKLKSGFQLHLRQTEQHVKRIEQIANQLGVSPRGKKCKAMAGLVAEGQETIDENKVPEVLDAGLIAAAQRVEHYEIAAYGTLIAYAQLMSKGGVIDLLQSTLDEEKETDQKLTVLAESTINRMAV
jgi:ferritin-like metal-binding protein YciE